MGSLAKSRYGRPVSPPEHVLDHRHYHQLAVSPNTEITLLGTSVDGFRSRKPHRHLAELLASMPVLG